MRFFTIAALALVLALASVDADKSVGNLRQLCTF